MADLTQEMQEVQETQEQQLMQLVVAEQDGQAVEQELRLAQAQQPTDKLYNLLLAACVNGNLEQRLLTIKTAEEAETADKVIYGADWRDLTLPQVRNLVSDVEPCLCAVRKCAYNRDDPDLMDLDRDCFETPEAFGVRLGDAAELFFTKSVRLSVMTGLVNPLEPDHDEEMLISTNLPCFRKGYTPGFWWVKAVRLENVALPKPWLLRLCSDALDADYIMVSLQKEVPSIKEVGIYQRPFAKGALMLIPVGYAKMEYRQEIDGRHSVEEVQKARAKLYKEKHHEKKLQKWQAELDARKAMSAAVSRRVKCLQNIEDLVERFAKLDPDDVKAALPAMSVKFVAGLYDFQFGAMKAEYTDEAVTELAKMVEKAEQDVAIYQCKKRAQGVVLEVASGFPIKVKDLATDQTFIYRDDIPFRSPMCISLDDCEACVYDERDSRILDHIYYRDVMSVSATLAIIGNCYKRCRGVLLSWLDQVCFKVKLG